MPTGVGEAKPLTQDSINHLSARWLPDGKRFVFSGNEPGHALRLYVQSAAGGKPQAISPEGVGTRFVVSPSGDMVAGLSTDHKINLYPVQGGDPRPVPGVEANEVPTGWSSDGRSLFVLRYGELPARVVQVDVASGQRKPWKDLVPADAAGIDTISGVMMTPDGKAYVYSYVRTLCDLYLVEGLK
jgi:Tol biopolymer transport system component